MASEDIRAFLTSIDAELIRHAQMGETLDLHLIGRSALILGYNVQLMTKDVDVIHVDGMRLLEIAVRIFGKGSAGHASHDFYLEAVSSGLPPLPIGYQGRCVDIPGPWQVIRPKQPEAHDLIATKLKRFHQGDREDVRIICDTGNVDTSILRERIDSAYAFSDRDDPKVVLAFENLEAVVDYLNGQRRTL